MTARAARTLAAGVVLAFFGGGTAALAPAFSATYWLAAAAMLLGIGLIVGVGQATDARDRPLSRAELEDLWRRP